MLQLGSVPTVIFCCTTLSLANQILIATTGGKRRTFVTSIYTVCPSQTIMYFPVKNIDRKNSTEPEIYYKCPWGTRWLRHCVTSREVAGSIPDGVIGIVCWWLQGKCGGYFYSGGVRNDFLIKVLADKIDIGIAVYDFHIQILIHVDGSSLTCVEFKFESGHPVVYVR
jgi:hypothetical protein